MSTSDSDIEESYDTDDSEWNYIPGYTIEDELSPNEQQAAGGACSQPLQDSYSTLETDSTEGPYVDEPIADEEWLLEYNRQREAVENFNRQLQNRCEGNEHVNLCCKCGYCHVEQLQNANEYLCCTEIEECVESLTSEQVMQEVETPPKCVTLHPGFSPVCLQKWSLRLAADKYKTKEKKRYGQTGSEERLLRSVAYREFTRLVHGYLGGTRIPLPACAYHAIRKKFYDKEFTGFEVEEN